MISVLVPSRTDEFLQQLLQSMETSEPASTRRVIVGDNGISAALRDRWPDVTFVDVQKPFVFAKAINTCAAAAPPENDLLLLNDDTQVETPHWITMTERMLREPQVKEYGLISLAINGGVGNEDQKARGLGPTDILESQRTICFVAGLIPRRAWTAIGGLDERFTGYGFDDDDYCVRLRKANLRVGVCGAATVKHGAAGYPHSSSYCRLLGQAEWDRQYKLNGRIFQAKWGMNVVTNRMCLNLGCGNKPRPSEGLDVWINLDIAPHPGVQVVRDLRRGLPWSGETFDHILADNVLEHFDSGDFIFILNEIDRVLKIGGTVEMIVPHAHSQGAIQDPTHKMLFVPRSAMYWNQVTTPMGGAFVGITANLVPTNIEMYGDEKTELFLRFSLQKQALPTTQEPA